jgi:hypothetical protein
VQELTEQWLNFTFVQINAGAMADNETIEEEDESLLIE